MLPNRLNLSKQTEDRLRRLKQNTGITPNVAARIAFFRSYEKGFHYTNSKIKLDGPLTLDKFTWFGETQTYVELLLKDRYPDLDGKELSKAWAAHVEDGIVGISNLRTLSDFTEAILD